MEAGARDGSGKEGLSDVARRVCLSVGRDVIGSLDGAEQISRILRERFAPGDID